ncbi:HNH endonuclease [Sneathiella marina]|uniref:HNH endonuclease n=1 Tax=Sneathiella marina TaxID=2950108 RepID=A0ABY4W409_9PROT|nr:HNH endonuclease [Sneathiella marina]USG61773.1 HNH endonuclease [Sneathiella marina]
MGLGVFIHRSDSRYDDTPAERYQFPGNYLTRVQACVQNWIVYLEPSKVQNTRGYFAIAKVEKVVPDPTMENMYLALIEQGSYLDFINPVPFNDGTNIVERGLLNEKGKLSGRAQSAVRPILPEDFDRILELGFDEQQPELPRIGDIKEDQPFPGMAEDQAPYVFEQPRVRVNQMTSRVVRDRLFRRLVLKAYDKRCAITGLQLINGGGRAEVDAAHIKPVEANGPDILSNGIALSGTAHWMFDRGLIGLTDDHEIMISRHVNNPDSVESLINRSGKAIVPGLPVNQPHPSFLKWHRENCFKV